MFVVNIFFFKSILSVIELQLLNHGMIIMFNNKAIYLNKKLEDNTLNHFISVGYDNMLKMLIG